MTPNRFVVPWHLSVLCCAIWMVSLGWNGSAVGREVSVTGSRSFDSTEAPPAYVITGDKGEIVMVAGNNRTTVTPAGAEQPLYDPIWQVVWFQRRQQLVVADLTAATKGCCVVVATTLPLGASLMVERTVPPSVLEYAPTCDHDNGVSLVIGAGRATISSIKDGASLRLTASGERWFREQSRRPVRAAPQHLEFLPGQATPVWVPKATGQCTATQACNLSVPFGPDGRRLVLVADEREDCWHGQCLLFDPKMRRFGTPPAPNSWHVPPEAAPGSCGPYRFSPDQRWFLTETQVCRLDGLCLPTGGRVLGWLAPGPVVGAPG